MKYCSLATLAGLMISITAHEGPDSINNQTQFLDISKEITLPQMLHTLENSEVLGSNFKMIVSEIAKLFNLE